MTPAQQPCAVEGADPWCTTNIQRQHKQLADEDEVAPIQPEQEECRGEVHQIVKHRQSNGLQRNCRVIKLTDTTLPWAYLCSLELVHSTVR